MIKSRPKPLWASPVTGRGKGGADGSDVRGVAAEAGEKKGLLNIPATARASERRITDPRVNDQPATHDVMIVSGKVKAFRKSLSARALRDSVRFGGAARTAGVISSHCSVGMGSVEGLGDYLQKVVRPQVCVEAQFETRSDAGSADTLIEPVQRNLICWVTDSHHVHGVRYVHSEHLTSSLPSFTALHFVCPEDFDMSDPPCSLYQADLNWQSVLIVEARS